MEEKVIDATKDAFLSAWTPQGYKELWHIYGKYAKMSEREFVEICLKPFYNLDHVCLELGSGNGWWTMKYLALNFKHVIALDVIPKPSKFDHRKITYVELPDRNFDCFGVVDESVDFVFGFGLFPHLTLAAIQQYLYAIYRVCKIGAQCVFSFSNTERRPGCASVETTGKEIPWIRNTVQETLKMLVKARFQDITDLTPWSCELILSCKKS
jgi:ubiquinone/menaquinone biosynthesis C-methylase UbiE